MKHFTFDRFNKSILLSTLFLVFFSGISSAQPPCATTDIISDVTCGTGVGSGGIYLCASSTIPDCAACSTSCSGAVSCVYYSLRNCLNTYDCSTQVDIEAISIVIRRDTNSSKWRICNAQKNFGLDCYTTDYGIQSVGSPTLGYTGTDGNCTTWVGGAPCQDYRINFIPPTSNPTGCGNSADANWLIPPGDEFSFTLCGADDGANCCGIDITLTFGWFDNIPSFHTHHTYTRTYTCITSGVGTCNNGCIIH